MDGGVVQSDSFFRSLQRIGTPTMSLNAGDDFGVVVCNLRSVSLARDASTLISTGRLRLSSGMAPPNNKQSNHAC